MARVGVVAVQERLLPLLHRGQGRARLQPRRRASAAALVQPPPEGGHQPARIVQVRVKADQSLPSPCTQPQTPPSSAWEPRF